MQQANRKQVANTTKPPPHLQGQNKGAVKMYSPFQNSVIPSATKQFEIVSYSVESDVDTHELICNDSIVSNFTVEFEIKVAGRHYSVYMQQENDTAGFVSSDVFDSDIDSLEEAMGYEWTAENVLFNKLQGKCAEIFWSLHNKEADRLYAENDSGDYENSDEAEYCYGQVREDELY